MTRHLLPVYGSVEDIEDKILHTDTVDNYDVLSFAQVALSGDYTLSLLEDSENVGGTNGDICFIYMDAVSDFDVECVQAIEVLNVMVAPINVTYHGSSTLSIIEDNNDDIFSALENDLKEENVEKDIIRLLDSANRFNDLGTSGPIIFNAQDSIYSSLILPGCSSADVFFQVATIGEGASIGGPDSLSNNVIYNAEKISEISCELLRMKVFVTEEDGEKSIVAQPSSTGEYIFSNNSHFVSLLDSFTPGIITSISHNSYTSEEEKSEDDSSDVCVAMWEVHADHMVPYSVEEAEDLYGKMVAVSYAYDAEEDVDVDEDDEIDMSIMDSETRFVQGRVIESIDIPIVKTSSLPGSVVDAIVHSFIEGSDDEED